MSHIKISCSKEGCDGSVNFEDADYDYKEASDNGGVFEELSCNKCGTKYKTVIWAALIDDEGEFVSAV